MSFNGKGVAPTTSSRLFTSQYFLPTLPHGVCVKFKYQISASGISQLSFTSKSGKTGIEKEVFDFR